MPSYVEGLGSDFGVEAVVLARREDPGLRLFGFPHAGGNSNSFAGWDAGLPPDVELISYTLPGRTWQQDRPAYQDWSSLVDELVHLVDRHDDGTPFVFFGHSFGALVAFEVCRELIAAQRRAPAVLLLSAHRAPHLRSQHDWRTLAADRVLDQVRDWGLIPSEYLDDEELRELMLPALLSDLRLDQDYRCLTAGSTGDRLAVPCVVYGGSDDATVHPDELRAWAEHFESGSPFEVEILPGGHFYTTSSRDSLMAAIGARLERVRAEVGPSVAVTPVEYPIPHLGVWNRFQQQVAANPDATALLAPARRWSYQELSDSATDLAGQLTGLGIEPGTVVGLLLPHSPEYCISLLVCFGMGMPACLLEKNWPASLLSQFLDSAGVEIVLTTPELVELLPVAFRTPSRVLVLDPARPLRKPDAAVVFPPVRPSDIALISMTSGTSGTPKAVVNTHHGCLYCFDARYDRYPYEQASRDGLNVFFGWECLRPLLQGRAGVVIPDDWIFDPVRLVDALAEFRITRIVVPPSLFESVLDHPAAGPMLVERLGLLEIVFLMGEVVPARLVAKAAALLPPTVRLVNAYSTWESLDVSYADLLPASGDEAIGSGQFAPVGRILPGSAAILLNDHGEPVPYGSVGELYFAGPGVATGYLNDPVKTAERFVACPPALRGSPFSDEVFYRTGDRARFLPSGELEILGRTGDVVKVRGFKVSLRAVEHALADQPEVARVIVRPVLDSRTGQPVNLLAYVLGEQGRPSETVLARLRHKARRDLPEYARPRHFIGLDEVPISRGDSRKLDLAALPPPPEEPAATSLDTSGGDSGPALSTVEQRVAGAWRDVLGVRSVDPDDNFFEVGGDSLSAARLSGLLADRYGISLAVIDVFQFSTLREMARRCSASGPSTERPVASRAGRRTRPAATELAVVGMAGRFPGAPDIEAYWQNLLAGTDSLTTFSADWLRAKGVPAQVLADPDWVPAAQLLADVDSFDAEFCGIGHREAVLMDPQHRVFVEVAWTALEQAGYARRDNPYRHRTGVFAACGIDGYLIHHLDGGGLRDPLDPGGVFLTEIGNEKDYIATRVAYLLDLGGPAITVTSACSSALVAIAQAAQSIVSGQCDMAIAGAASINFPNFGYRYEDGLVGSADGHVRPFDEAASGTLFGDSVGAVVLKRLDDAIADGDLIWSVLTGFGISNDGRMKAGYTAPSARAQAQCISDAIEMAGIGSEQISYVECHATATHIGDAIEVKGLADAFAAQRRDAEVRSGSCALGSVKGNIGHANCAAGITGFIKTVLCLHHRTLVPTANYRTLNPKLVDYIDCEGSPFTLAQSRVDWTVADPERQLPRRAGVSSFGIGGTNAHVILEEPPELPPEDGEPVGLHLVTVSGRSRSAFERNAVALADYLAGLPEATLGPAIRTLHARRESHSLRASTVLTSGSVAGRAGLSRLAEVPIAASQERAATVVFCFSGQGSQAAGMARGLYRGRADGGRFREHFDQACRSLAQHLPEDPATLILGADEESVKRPLTTQCGLFAVEYALARSLTDLGVRPVAMAGHSIGEYAAAVLAEVLTLDEAAALVAVRASATEQLLPPGTGGMLGVAGAQDRLADWLAGRPDLWLAVENAPGRVVLSGSAAALREAASELAGLGLTCRPLPVSHPFHSDLMAPVAEQLDLVAAGLSTRLPALPMAGNLTGSWLDARYQASRYWGEHLISKVRWRDDVDALLKWEPDIFLEIGPGKVLTLLNDKSFEHRGGRRPLALATMPEARNPESDDEADLLAAIGTLWCRGVEVDLAALHPGRPRASRPVTHRLPPTYSFDRTSYWSRPQASSYLDPAAEAVPASQGGLPAGTLVRFRAKPAARLVVYCFPYAGGTSAAFRSWAHAAPDWLDVVAVELPGRSSRSGDPLPVTDQEDATVLAELAAAIRADAGVTPAAFCGLSFGSALLFDLLSGPLTDWAESGRVSAISVVGRAPVNRSAGGVETPVEDYLMAPDELRQDPQWKQRMLHLLEADLGFDARAELRIAERQARHGARLVECPLQVHCGSTDPTFRAESAADWAEVTASPLVDVHRHPGSHDFMLVHREDILAQLVSFLDTLVPLVDRPAGRPYELRWTLAGPSDGASRAAAQVPWMHEPADPAFAARFVIDRLTGPRSSAALVCQPSAGRSAAALCARFLRLFQEVARAEARGTLILVLPARDTSGLVAGLTRSLAHEEPGLDVRRVYVHDWPAAVDDRTDWVDQLLRRAADHPDEIDLLYRGGHLLVQRLLPLNPPVLPLKALGAVQASYLVTGGGGGIGRAVVDWLIHQQAVAPDRVIVAGRTEPAGLRRGVRFLRLDLASPPDVLSAVGATGPLAGIFHLAGALDDGTLRNLDAARFTEVLAPKLAVPWLTELGRLTHAPWIVAFSSTSALFGAAGQANYAAANGWLDARAMWPERADGPSLVSIDWGTWREVGMAARSAKALASAAAAGEVALGTADALSHLGAVVSFLLAGAGVSNVAVCDLDWSRAPWCDSPLAGELPSPQAAAQWSGTRPARSSEPVPEPVGGAEDRSSDRIHSFLSDYVHRWEESTRLIDLGLDSLDFARMRGDFARQFGKEIPLAAIAHPEQRLGQLYSLLSGYQESEGSHEGEDSHARR